MAQENELKPWRVKSWCIGRPSAQYLTKIEDVLDVYRRPFDAKRPVVCLDETSKELRDTPRGSLPMASGQPERWDYEYARNGVCNLFMAIEPLQGRRRVRVTGRRTAQDFAEQLRVLVEEDYADAEVIVFCCPSACESVSCGAVSGPDFLRTAKNSVGIAATTAKPIAHQNETSYACASA